MRPTSGLGQPGQQVIQQLLNAQVRLLRPLAQHGLHLIRHHGCNGTRPLLHQLTDAGPQHAAGLTLAVQDAVYGAPGALQSLRKRGLANTTLTHPRLKLLTVAHALILGKLMPNIKKEMLPKVRYAPNKINSSLTLCIVCIIIQHRDCIVLYTGTLTRDENHRDIYRLPGRTYCMRSGQCAQPRPAGCAPRHHLRHLQPPQPRIHPLPHRLHHLGIIHYLPRRPLPAPQFH